MAKSSPASSAIASVGPESGAQRELVLLVTPRSAPEGRQRGTKAGTNQYVVKVDLDQGQLLTLRRKPVR